MHEHIINDTPIDLYINTVEAQRQGGDAQKSGSDSQRIVHPYSITSMKYDITNGNTNAVISDSPENVESSISNPVHTTNGLAVDLTRNKVDINTTSERQSPLEDGGTSALMDAVYLKRREIN